MHRSVNRVILFGCIGRDAETTTTSGGVVVSAAWRSENLAQYLLKGRQVLVEGRLLTQKWGSFPHQLPTKLVRCASSRAEVTLAP